MIANQLLSALPSVEPTTDDPAYAAELRELLAQHRATRTVPFTEGWPSRAEAPSHVAPLSPDTPRPAAQRTAAAAPPAVPGGQ